MTNISDLLIRFDPSPERLALANSWTSKGMKITEKARNELAQSPSRATEPECERVWAVLLYNMGAVLEVCIDVTRLVPCGPGLTLLLRIYRCRVTARRQSSTLSVLWCTLRK